MLKTLLFLCVDCIQTGTLLKVIWFNTCLLPTSHFMTGRFGGWCLACMEAVEPLGWVGGGACLGEEESSWRRHTLRSLPVHPADWYLCSCVFSWVVISKLSKRVEGVISPYYLEHYTLGFLLVHPADWYLCLSWVFRRHALLYPVDWSFCFCWVQEIDLYSYHKVLYPVKILSTYDPHGYHMLQRLHLETFFFSRSGVSVNLTLERLKTVAVSLRNKDQLQTDWGSYYLYR